MNEIILKGIIKDIQYSHSIEDIEYYQANIITNNDGRESINSLKFKRLSNSYIDNQNIELVGNIRNYSNSGKLDIYVFTYFDLPNEIDSNNFVRLDGRICKINELRTTKTGKENIQFILANNILSKTNKINSYIPCTAWGNIAKTISKLSINDLIEIEGELRSREYKKHISENEIEIRVAHEVVITKLGVL